jgi:hypothetical protein
MTMATARQWSGTWGGDEASGNTVNSSEKEKIRGRKKREPLEIDRFYM